MSFVPKPYRTWSVSGAWTTLTLQSCFSSHLVGSTGRVVVFEEGGVHLIHSSEVVDVGQQDGGLHHVVEGAVGRLQDVALRCELNKNHLRREKT